MPKYCQQVLSSETKVNSKNMIDKNILFRFYLEKFQLWGISGRLNVVLHKSSYKKSKSNFPWDTIKCTEKYNLDSDI